jgi:hypothetical protein
MINNQGLIVSDMLVLDIDGMFLFANIHTHAKQSLMELCPRGK